MLAFSVLQITMASPAIPNPGHGTSQLEGDADLNMNNNKIINLTTPVASSDAATKGYVDSSGGDDVSAVVAVAESPSSPYSLNWDAIQICQFGTCCPPWRDCDGDGKTYSASTDCDEGCATCYVGNTTGTAEADGKDQNCNGTIDELGGEFLAKTCNACSSRVQTETVIAACQSYCTSLGRGYVRYTMDYCSASCNHLYLNYDFSTCTASTPTSGNVPSCAGNNFRCYCQAAL